MRSLDIVSGLSFLSSISQARNSYEDTDQLQDLNLGYVLAYRVLARDTALRLAGEYSERRTFTHSASEMIPYWPH